MDAALALSATVGIQAACDHLGVSRASLYRQRPKLGPAPASAAQRELPSPPATRPAPPYSP